MGRPSYPLEAGVYTMKKLSTERADQSDPGIFVRFSDLWSLINIGALSSDAAHNICRWYSHHNGVHHIYLQAIRVGRNIQVSAMILSNVSHIAARYYQETHFAVYAPEAHIFYLYADRQTVPPNEPVDIEFTRIQYIIMDASHEKSIAEQWGYTAQQFFSQPVFCGTETQLCIYEIIINTRQP